MHKLAVALILSLSSATFAAPTLAQVRVEAPAPVRLNWSAAQIAKTKQEIALQEGRAAELQPMVTHDIQARLDFKADAAALDRNAKDMRVRAAEFRAIAATLTGKERDEQNAFANELELYASHDVEAAKIKRELAHQLDDVIKREQGAIQWHLTVAARLKTALANNS